MMCKHPLDRCRIRAEGGRAKGTFCDPFGNRKFGLYVRKAKY
jgi:hypothetical protein